MREESETIGDSAKANEPVIDVAAAVAAQVFGNLPLIGLDWLRSSIAMQANFAQLLPGATALSAADLNGPRNRADQEEQEAKDKSERMMDVMEEVARQREEWQRTTHSFGSTTMTGAEWQTMSEDLRDGGELRTWLLARIVADGHTRAEAERLADRAGDVAEIMATPDSQRTPEQRHELTEANRDPELHRYVDIAARHSQEMHGPHMARNEAVASGTTAASVDQGADAIEDFPTAPDLRAEFRTAQAATVPPDARRTGASASTAPAPQPVLASGFNV